MDISIMVAIYIVGWASTGLAVFGPVVLIYPFCYGVLAAAFFVMIRLYPVRLPADASESELNVVLPESRARSNGQREAVSSKRAVVGAIDIAD